MERSDTGLAQPGGRDIADGGLSFMEYLTP